MSDVTKSSQVTHLLVYTSELDAPASGRGMTVWNQSHQSMIKVPSVPNLHAIKLQGL
jgi:hypothetical protein